MVCNAPVATWDVLCKGFRATSHLQSHPIGIERLVGELPRHAQDVGVHARLKCGTLNRILRACVAD